MVRRAPCDGLAATANSPRKGLLTWVFVQLDNMAYHVPMASDELGKLLRDLRASRGETLRSAAAALEVDPSHLSRVERGEKQPSPELQRRAANYYHVESSHLALAAGDIPPDIVEILRANPNLVERLRRDYGSSS